jgi:hypothetical protein
MNLAQAEGVCLLGIGGGGGSLVAMSMGKFAGASSVLEVRNRPTPGHEHASCPGFPFRESAFSLFGCVHDSCLPLRSALEFAQGDPSRPGPVAARPCGRPAPCAVCRGMHVEDASIPMCSSQGNIEPPWLCRPGCCRWRTSQRCWTGPWLQAAPRVTRPRSLWLGCPCIAWLACCARCDLSTTLYLVADLMS